MAGLVSGPESHIMPCQSIDNNFPQASLDPWNASNYGTYGRKREHHCVREVLPSVYDSIFFLIRVIGSSLNPLAMVLSGQGQIKCQNRAFSPWRD